VAAQVLGLAAAPILTRLYPAGAFGVLALYFSLVSIFGMIACLRFDVAIPLAESEKDAVGIMAIALLSATAITGLVGAIVVLAGPAICRLIGAPFMATTLGWVPVSVLLVGVTSTLTYWMYRKERFGTTSAVNVLRSVSSAGTKLALGLKGLVTGMSLVLGEITGACLAAGGLCRSALRNDRSLFREGLSWPELLALARRFRRFPLVDVFNVLLNNASWQIPVFLVNAFFSRSVLGLYSLTFRVLQLPVMLVGSAIGQVYYQRIGRLLATGDSPAGLTAAVFQRLAYLAVFPATTMVVAGPVVFATVFGRGWWESGVYARILGAWLCCWILASPLSLFYLASQRQRRLLAFQVVIFVSRLVSLVGGGVYGDVHVALLLFSATGILVYGCLAVDVLRLAGVGYINAAGAVIRAASCMMPPLAIGLLGGNISDSGVLILAFWLIAGLVYALLVMVADRELRQQMLSVAAGRHGARG